MFKLEARIYETDG